MKNGALPSWKDRSPCPKPKKEKKKTKEKFVPWKYDKETDTFIEPGGTRVRVNVVD